MTDLDQAIAQLSAQLAAHEREEAHSAGCFADDAILVDARKLKAVIQALARRDGVEEPVALLDMAAVEKYVRAAFESYADRADKAETVALYARLVAPSLIHKAHPAPTAPGDCASIRETVHAWIREDVGLNVKMTLFPEVVAKLVDRLAALRQPDTTEDACMGRGEGGGREAIAKIVFREELRRLKPDKWNTAEKLEAALQERWADIDRSQYYAAADAIAALPTTTMLVDQDWLRRRMDTDPDLPCEAGEAIQCLETAEQPSSFGNTEKPVGLFVKLDTGLWVQSATQTGTPLYLRTTPADPRPASEADDEIDGLAVTEAICRDRIERKAATFVATDDLVDRFAAALKEKLRAAAAKYGYSDAWMNGGWRDDLIRDLTKHVQKGDPRDVAAYCAFAWHHGWSVADPRPDPRDEALREAREAFERIKTSLSYAVQDASPEAIAQANRNLAWHTADQALAKINAVIGGEG